MENKVAFFIGATLVSGAAIAGAPASAPTSAIAEHGMPATAAQVTVPQAWVVRTAEGGDLALPSPNEILVPRRPPSHPAYIEPTPEPRAGQVWLPGHWEWQGDDYYWVHGKFEAARPGYYYREPQWLPRGERWAYQGGGWTRGDRYRDGIRNRRDVDRDGDGVPDRFDRFPGDRNRR